MIAATAEPNSTLSKKITKICVQLRPYQALEYDPAVEMLLLTTEWLISSSDADKLGEIVARRTDDEKITVRRFDDNYKVALVKRLVVASASSQGKEACTIADRPKPSKVKDLRSIRQAIDETDRFYCLLAGENEAIQRPDALRLISEALLIAIDQLDLLQQLVDDAALMPTQVVEHNRLLRTLLRQMMQTCLTQAEQRTLLQLIQVTGNQLKSLLIVKEIRAQVTIASPK